MPLAFMVTEDAEAAADYDDDEDEDAGDGDDEDAGAAVGGDVMVVDAECIVDQLSWSVILCVALPHQSGPDAMATASSGSSE